MGSMLLLKWDRQLCSLFLHFLVFSLCFVFEVANSWIIPVNTLFFTKYVRFKLMQQNCYAVTAIDDLSPFIYSPFIFIGRLEIKLGSCMSNNFSSRLG